MPKISIIIPVYNCEDTLDNCVSSVLNQTYKDFELILVNDGSKDNSQAIAKRIKESDKRVSLYSKDNGGASSARNFGIKKSSGDYIMFIDADDYISSNCLELFVNNLKEDIDCIFGRLNRVDNLNNIINISQEETKPQIFEEQQIIELRKNLLQEFLPKIDYFRGPVCKLYRKSIILENDIQFDEKITHGEDCLFNSMFFSKCKKAIFVDAKLYHYYANPKSITNRLNTNIISNYEYQFSKLYEIIESEQELHAYFYNYVFARLRNIFSLYIFHKDFQGNRKEEFNKIFANNFIKESLKRLDTKYLSKKERIKYYLVKFKCYPLLKRHYLKK